MKKNKKMIMLGLSLTAILGMNTLSAFASDDDIGYSFTIKANYGNTYSDSRYRQTSDSDNKWKVNMTYSSEGAGTITTYWLALFNGSHTVVSDTHNVKQGSGAHYYSATSGASQKDVCLGAENNNNSPNTYTVSGYWDEETN